MNVPTLYSGFRRTLLLLQQNRFKFFILLRPGYTFGSIFLVCMCFCISRIPNMASNENPMLKIRCWLQDKDAITPPQEHGIESAKLRTKII